MIRNSFVSMVGGPRLSSHTLPFASSKVTNASQAEIQGLSSK